MDDIERLKVAFGLDMLRRVAAADGRVDDREWDLIEKAWPDGTLQRLGFVDEDGPTDVWRDVAIRARTELAHQMSDAEKLLLLGFFYTVCMADGVLHPRELREVHEAAGYLGISVERLGAHLDAMTGHAGEAPPRRS